MAPARTEPQVGEWTEHRGWIAIAAARCIHSRAIDNVQRTYTLEELKAIAEREGYSAISVHSSGRTVLMRFSIQLTLGQCQQATGHTIYIRTLPPIAAAGPVREVMELPHEEASPPLVGEREEVAPENEVVPESEAAPEPAAERPSLLSRLTSWRVPQEPDEGTTVEVVAPRGQLGLVFDRSSTMLAKIKDGSPLSNLVQVGWTLVAVNDVDVEDLDGRGVTMLLLERAHEARRLTFQTSSRGNQQPALAGEAEPPFAAPHRAQSPAREEAYDQEAAEASGNAEKTPPEEQTLLTLRHGWALTAAVFACLLQMLALLENRHWAMLTFDIEHEIGYYLEVYDVEYDLWGWTITRDIFRAHGGEIDFLGPESHEGSACNVGSKDGEEVKEIPGNLGAAACKARTAARAGTIICLVLSLAVSAVLARCKPLQRQRFKALGSVLAFGGFGALATTSFYVYAYEGQFATMEKRPEEQFGVPHDTLEAITCSRGCLDAFGGGFLALVAGLAMACSRCCHGNEFPSGPLALKFGFLLVLGIFVVTAYDEGFEAIGLPPLLRHHPEGTLIQG